MPHRPSIFISATTRDLKSCRQSVRDALLTLGCAPVVQDHFAPEASTVREMLRKRIAACDAVIHLAGLCYGAEARERPSGEPRRSYTQTEYDIAVELKKPLYIFVCAEDFPYDACEPEDDERRDLQRRHRAALTGGDRLYQSVGNAAELDLRVRELQTRVEQLTRDLQKTRSWLGRSVAAALVALAFVGGGLDLLHQRAARTDTRVTQVSDELDRYRQAVKQLADRYGKDLEPGRKLTDEEKFDRALAAVAEQQKIGVPELKMWLDVFVTQVQANPGADFYDRALADFAQKHFADASANATKSAEQFRMQREAAEKEQAAAGQRAIDAGAKERRAWSLVGDSEYAAGHYAAAVEPYRQALALCDENKDPLVWCDAAQPLELVLWRMGRYAEAEGLARRCVDRRTALQGAEHRTTLNSVSHLANILNAKGDSAGAEPLYRRALEAQERTLGKDHPETLQSANNLANLVSDEGNLAEAEGLYRRVLETRERLLGEENPSTLNARSNLAILLKDKGDLPAAETLYRSVLEARERVLGSDHPETIASVNNLANLLADRGDATAAEGLYRRALDSLERTLGKDHPLTLNTLGNLALLLADKGDRTAAEPLYRRALEALGRTLGKEHPQYAMTAYNLSLLLRDEGRLDEALTLAQAAVAAARASLPENAPHRLTFEKHLAELQTKVAAAKSPAS